MISVALAGLLGAGGVSLAAAAAHVQDSVAIRAAAELAMVHAVGVIALMSVSHRSNNRAIWTLVAWAMLVGATLFSGAVAISSLADLRPIPGAAPTGGILVIIAWLGVFLAGILEWFSQDASEDMR